MLNPAKHVFATMLTDDGYLPGVQLLHFSMEKHINSYLVNKDKKEHQNQDFEDIQLGDQKIDVNMT